MQHLKIYSKKDILDITHIRKFETKMGEEVAVVKSVKDIESSPARFVLLGISEDIGVKANNGQGGADTAWTPFIQSFLNLQSNDFMRGNDIIVLGHFNFSDLGEVIEGNATNADEKVEAYRHAVNTIDDEVESLIKTITSFKKIPIVIGGGHNNAYPLIKGAAKGLNKAGVIPLAQINAINLDAHSDYRPTEGRHSGNGFRYAEEDGYLQKYFMLGLHENYLPQNVWVDIVNNPFIDCITYEDIFLHGKRNFIEAIADGIDFTNDTACGIELDLDCIENVLSSAVTPCGITPVHARHYINMAASEANIAYLHVCEGASQMSDGRRDDTIGKLISYFVSDFVKAMSVVNAEDNL